MPIFEHNFGKLSDGTPIRQFTFENKNSVQVKIINLGGIITSIKVPDRTGQLGEITLGFDALEQYESEHPCFGAIIGRYGNRIANARFTLNGKDYQLAANHPPSHLHGGKKGFDKVVWQAKVIENQTVPSLELTYLSRDGEEGYPGNLQCRVTYALTDDNELQMIYHATTDQATVLNLTNHAYFNLKDGGASDCLEHEVCLYADYYTPVNRTVIPTGEIRSVKRTPFNFLKPKKIGKQINTPHQQLIIANGYDHNFVLSEKENLKKAAHVVEPSSGRTLTVFTTEPGVQFYTANWLDGTLVGHKKITYQKRCAFCLETQHFPNSPNIPHFPSTVLLPNETFESMTIYKFGY